MILQEFSKRLFFKNVMNYIYMTWDIRQKVKQKKLMIIYE